MMRIPDHYGLQIVSEADRYPFGLWRKPVPVRVPSGQSMPIIWLFLLILLMITIIGIVFAIRHRY